MSMPYPSPPVHSWPTDVRVEYEERAALKQYDGGMTRENAEWEAYYETRAHHPIPTAKGGGGLGG